MSKQLRKRLMGAETTFDKMKVESRGLYEEQVEQEDTIKKFKKAILFDEKLLAEDTWLLKLSGEHIYLSALHGTFPKLKELLFGGFCHHTAFPLTPSVTIWYDDGDLSMRVQDSKALDFLENEGVKVNLGHIGGGIAKLKERLDFLEGLKLMFADMET